MKKTIPLTLLFAALTTAAQTPQPAAKPVPPRTAQEVPPGTKTYPLGPDSIQQPGVPAGTLSP